MRLNRMNALFAILCGMLLFSAIGYRAVEKIGIVERQSRSQLESRTYQSMPKLSLKALSNSSFQDKFEQFVADSVPFRDDMLLLNAGVQRLAIGFSNILFSYDAYPTFYGSDRVNSDKLDAVLPIVNKVTNEQRKRYEQASSDLTAFAARHPDKRVYLLGVDDSKRSAANPTAHLVSDPLLTEEIQTLLSSKLSADITYVKSVNTSADQLISSYYRTDHHWRTREGYRAYAAALAEMMPGEKPAQITDTRVFGASFIGADARVGLCIPKEADQIEDYRVSLDAVRILIDGKEVKEDAIDSWEKYSNGGAPTKRFTNLYGNYYHGNFELIEFENTRLSNDNGLLIIGDSYTNCLERFFTANYRYVYVFDARESDQVADDIISNYPTIRDVLIIDKGTTLFEGGLDSK